MIARNEEKTIPRLAASLRGFMDRGGVCVLLDTGSTDDTVEIAKELGFIVYGVGDKFIKKIDEEMAKKINKMFVVDEDPIVKEGDRIFNFGAARNFVAEKSPTDWVWALDCDEELTTLDLDKVEEAIADPQLGSLEYDFVYSHDDEGNEAIKFLHSKLYRKSKMKWGGIVHEVLNGTGERLFVDDTVIKLEHFQNQETDRSGYLKGLALGCYITPANDRNSHYLGRELAWKGRPKSAIKELHRHLTLGRWPAEKCESMLIIGDCHLSLGQDYEALEWYNRGYAEDGARREPLARLAQYYADKNDPLRTSVYATAMLQIPWSNLYCNNAVFYNSWPHEKLYWAKGWLGDINEAKLHLIEALKYQPHNGKYLHDTRFYFEYPDQGIEGWMTFEELTFLYEISKSMNSVCEVGSWKGRSTHALLSGCKGQVTAVDHFKGSRSDDKTHMGQPYPEFKKNVLGFNNLTILKEESVKAAKKVGKFDMVFIDAGHTYEDVVKDIRAWKGKANVLFCGHDYCDEWPGVKKAVDEEIGPVQVVGSIWCQWVGVPAPKVPAPEPFVSIIIPTIGRKKKLKRLLDSIRDNAGYQNYEVIVAHDGEDWHGLGFYGDALIFRNEKRLGVPETLKRAVQQTKGELIMFLGNDCVAKADFLKNAVEKMKTFPLRDGLVGLNDGYWKGEMATHWLASKKLLRLLEGEFFHTGYHHVGCDNELTQRCKKMGKYVWAENAEVYHDHPIQNGIGGKGFKGKEDRVYKLGRKHEKEDRALLKKRSEELGFDLKENFLYPVNNG